MEFTVPEIAVVREEDNITEILDEAYDKGFIPFFVRNNKEINEDLSKKITIQTGLQTKVLGVIYLYSPTKQYYA